MNLSDQEIRALRGMRSFQLTLEQVVEHDESEARMKQAARDAKRCDGGTPIQVDGVMVCSECGWEPDRRYYGVRHIQKTHWKDNKSNPLREDNLSGKAAQAADGDWYGSH